MNHTTKRNALLLLSGALAALLVLAASLSGMQLAAGTPFTSGSSSEESGLADELIYLVETQPRPLLQGIVALGFVGLLLYLGYRIYRHINLRTIVRIVLALIVLFSLAVLLPSLDIGQSAVSPGAFSGAEAPLHEQPVPGAPGSPPPALIWLVILVVFAGIAWLAFKILQQRLAPIRNENPLLDHAQQAVEDLYAGLDLREVVLRCYVQMTHTLQEKHGIQRDATMTAREFDHWLAQEGFPAAPVHQLTSLFEKMRYSRQKVSTPDDERLAIASLNAFIQASRKER